MTLTPVPNHTDLYGKLSIMEKSPTNTSPLNQQQAYRKL